MEQVTLLQLVHDVAWCHSRTGHLRDRLVHPWVARDARGLHGLHIVVFKQ
jgi:hypothetical protein